MKPTIAMILLLGCVQAAEKQPVKELNLDGHVFKVIFQTTIETNNTRARLFGSLTMTNYMFYLHNPERPFPRTNFNTETYEVVSNNIVLFVLDATTNKVITDSKVIATITETTTEIVRTVSETATTKIYKPTP